MNNSQLNIIAVDDEQLALELSERAIREALPDAALSCFSDTDDALAFAKENSVGIAFLDIEMPGMDGIELAKNLKMIDGKTNIVFVTGYAEYALDSYKVKASEYLLKPVSVEAVKDALEHLRHPIDHKTGARVYVQTFGNFEVFTYGKPILFELDKTKALFAYLVHRKGAVTNNNEIMAVIFEDKEETESLKSQFRNLVSDLTRTLKKLGLQRIIVKKYGAIGIMTDEIVCDYYDFLKGIPYAVNSYADEYMAQYSWAEFTAASLSALRG